MVSYVSLPRSVADISDGIFHCCLKNFFPQSLSLHRPISHLSLVQARGSPVDFCAHYNIVILIYLLTYLGLLVCWWSFYWYVICDAVAMCCRSSQWLRSSIKSMKCYSRWMLCLACPVCRKNLPCTSPTRTRRAAADLPELMTDFPVADPRFHFCPNWKKYGKLIVVFD